MLEYNQAPDTQGLVFEVPLHHWFERQTFIKTGISKFNVTRWVDKTPQEAGS